MLRLGERGRADARARGLDQLLIHMYTCIIDLQGGQGTFNERVSDYKGGRSSYNERRRTTKRAAYTASTEAYNFGGRVLSIPMI